MKPSADIRISRQTLAVLEALLEEPAAWRYGYDLSRETRLKSGTLYPVLMRLAERRLLETRWESVEPGRPPRHMYRLTTRGAELARAKLSKARAKRAVALCPCALEKDAVRASHQAGDAGAAQVELVARSD